MKAPMPGHADPVPTGGPAANKQPAHQCRFDPARPQHTGVPVRREGPAVLSPEAVHSTQRGWGFLLLETYLPRPFYVNPYNLCAPSFTREKTEAQRA